MENIIQRDCLGHEQLKQSSWEKELGQSICSVSHLATYTPLTERKKKALERIVTKHPMRITRYYASLIDWSDPGDPIRKMAVPSLDELNVSGSYDTSGELSNTKVAGLQHKYPQTALILATDKCAMYCRYCFRKRMVSLDSPEVMQNSDEVTAYLREHKEISNVLLSGGDPFVLPTEKLGAVLEKLSRIRHLIFIRFGTRTPATFPHRILEDRELIHLLKQYSAKHKRIYISTQFNHPREITPEATQAINLLTGAGLLVNNQAVLLRGVNDNPRTLARLMKKLVKIGVVPYYVFQCRPVKRVKQHFQIPLCRGYRIVEGSNKMLSGYSKRFRYVMSNKAGKIEIVGIEGGKLYFKYHQAKDHKNNGRLFCKEIKEGARWLDKNHKLLTT